MGVWGALFVFAVVIGPTAAFLALNDTAREQPLDEVLVAAAAFGGFGFVIGVLAGSVLDALMLATSGAGAVLVFLGVPLSLAKLARR